MCAVITNRERSCDSSSLVISVERTARNAGYEFTVLKGGDKLGKTTARLVNIWRNPQVRALFDATIKACVTPLTESRMVNEVVVGGGLHAAVYAATTESITGECPVALVGNRPGGVFATSLSPAFYLNSRNRPNELGLPGTGAALNVIPNGVIQPADLDGREFQTNAEFAFAIRANIVLFSQCYRTTVTSIEKDFSLQRAYYLRNDSNGPVRTDRAILATGAGEPSITVKGHETECVYTFTKFLRLVETNQFPFEGWNNVAVIGAQDSGCSVVMAMLGQGPIDPGPATLGTVERITWYGQSCTTKEEYETVVRGGARSLYASIGRYMPRYGDPNRYYRVLPREDRAYAIEPDSGGARVVYGPDRRVSERYDHVVTCSGFRQSINDIISTQVDSSLPGNSNLPLREEIVYDDELGPIAKRIVGTEIYKVGPCAELPVTPAERAQSSALDLIPANSAAAFRYVLRTARLAEILAET